jgi:hypothetical protein
MATVDDPDDPLSPERLRSMDVDVFEEPLHEAHSDVLSDGEIERLRECESFEMSG